MFYLTMKNTLTHVILSGAKNLKWATDHDGSREILRCAQNDMCGPVIYGVLLLTMARGRFFAPLRMTCVRVFFIVR